MKPVYSDSLSSCSDSQRLAASVSELLPADRINKPDFSRCIELLPNACRKPEFDEAATCLWLVFIPTGLVEPAEHMKPIHERHPDAIAVYSVAIEHEHAPPITGYRRAAAGAYGPIFCVDGVMCASREELHRRGILRALKMAYVTYKPKRADGRFVMRKRIVKSPPKKREYKLFCIRPGGSEFSSFSRDYDHSHRWQYTVFARSVIEAKRLSRSEIWAEDAQSVGIREIRQCHCHWDDKVAIERGELFVATYRR
jgi:hypothetical protein